MTEAVLPATTVSARDRDRVPLPLTIGLLFAISWIGTVPQIYASWRGAAAVPGWMKLLQLCILAPAFVALAVEAANGGWPAAKALLVRLFRWRAAPQVYAAVLLGPPLVILGAILLSNATGLSAVAVPDAATALSRFAPIFLAYFLLNTEELAWRGYVLPRFLERWSPLATTGILGVIWAVFHSPYFLMKGGHPGGLRPLFFFVMVMAMTVVMTALFLRTKGSVLLPHLLHQSINAWSEALPELPRFAGSAMPATFAVTALVVLAIALVLRNRAAWLARPA